MDNTLVFKQLLLTHISENYVVWRTRLSTVGDRAFSGRCFPAVEHSAAERHVTSRRRRHWLYFGNVYRLI